MFEKASPIEEYMYYIYNTYNPVGFLFPLFLSVLQKLNTTPRGYRNVGAANETIYTTTIIQQYTKETRENLREKETYAWAAITIQRTWRWNGNRTD